MKPKIRLLAQVDPLYWRDGLWAALQSMGLEDNDVTYEFSTTPEQDEDIVLVWGAFGSQQQKAALTDEFSDVPKAICVAGGPIEHPDVHKFDVVFVETPWHVEQFRKIGVDAKWAFGTNTRLFRHIEGLPTNFDWIYPAAFAKWKRHDLFAKKTGERLAVGYMQPEGHEKECIEVCVENGVTVMPQVMPEVLVWLYNQAGCAFTTPEIDGGGERTVLESYACGIDVQVHNENEKLVSLVDLIENEGLPSYKDYANALHNGIQEVI